MKYQSTRGNAPVLEFGDVLLAGLAEDGGLYVPTEFRSLQLLIILRRCRRRSWDSGIGTLCLTEYHE